MPPDLAADKLLDGLTPAQRAAVLSEAAPLCILASAGAGKTRVLTRRIAYRSRSGLADPSHTLALTFTRKAAAEMQHRLRQLGLRDAVAAGTFHSLASSQLQRWWADRRQPPPTLLERKSRILAPLALTRPGLAHVPVAELAGHIEWAQARMISPDDFEVAIRAHGRTLPAQVAAASLAGLYARYEHEKQRRGLIDFDDLLTKCAGAIERDPEFAGAQRWRWRHIYVDEFQDLNPLQHRLLLAWLGLSTDLCVVGDPNQAIYGWNGSDPGLLDQIPRRWPSAGVLHLDANHRSTEQIVAAAASVLGPAGTHLRSAGRQGPGPAVYTYATETAEADGIAEGLRRTGAGGGCWSSMAVLTRTNAQLIPIQKALTAAGIPFWAPSQAALLSDPVARQVLLDLRHSAHLPMQSVIANLDEMSGDSTEPAGPGRPDDGARAVLTALADLARSFAAGSPGSQAGEWVAWLPVAARDTSDERSGADRVTLCSFHRAKGLEWDAVWVAGLEQGLVPIGRAGSPEADREERRLLYVALTRAASQLHCSWARHRTFGTHPVRRDPSPWLELILVAGASEGGETQSSPSPGWRDQLSEQRRALREASKSARRPLGSRLPEGWPDPDPDLIRSIRSWRLETARATGVPAYVVLHDATVEALAALRPHTSEQLLEVPGLGPVKAGRYGPSLLSIVADRAASA